MLPHEMMIQPGIDLIPGADCKLCFYEFLTPVVVNKLKVRV